MRDWKITAQTSGPEKTETKSRRRTSAYRPGPVLFAAVRTASTTAAGGCCRRRCRCRCCYASDGWSLNRATNSLGRSLSFSAVCRPRNGLIEQRTAFTLKRLGRRWKRGKKAATVATAAVCTPHFRFLFIWPIFRQSLWRLLVRDFSRPDTLPVTKPTAPEH